MSHPVERRAALVWRWLGEDCTVRDITTAALLPRRVRGRAVIVARAAGILAGRQLGEAVFHTVARGCRMTWHVREGGRVRPGRRVLTIRGRLRAILSAERTALNILSHLSGVATATAAYVRAAHPVPVYATRKTIPGLRLWEKRAVEIGGGRTHRMHLADGLLVKDNHLAVLRAAGADLPAALRRLCRRWPGAEVEAKTLGEVELALGAGADAIMLDGMSRHRMRQAMAIIRGARAGASRPGRRRVEIEISGGVTLHNIRALARLRPDRISVGAITHSAPALDFSLDILPESANSGLVASHVTV